MDNEKDNTMESNIRSLWRAVILQAIIDATGDYKRTENKLEKDKAKAWIEEEGEEFKLVCELAGYNHKYVKNKALKTIKEHKKKKKKTTPSL